VTAVIVLGQEDAIMGLAKCDHTVCQHPSRSSGLSEKQRVPQLVKTFHAFYRTPRFITAFTRARHVSLSRAGSVQSMSPFSFLNIRFSVILPSTPGSCKWSPAVRSPHQTLYVPFLFPQPTFLPQCERPSFTPIQNNRQNYACSSVYLNLCIFG
jgi:hypothetical protein